ncbi:uncharacterized protein TM35_000162470 [Trypanosoma theileri]|uniref:Uncharacterized protein n=1 Tax=Trypanosoma theileri TaxID=67003 RepID=A0A1X0NWN7_9TRYP|nr:uncharacterized protein TM35_000162470 [Trypanosoma theileri]ORC88609.1 hypothetical protein TM35_000162470 [Trypanosoma theileri]
MEPIDDTEELVRIRSSQIDKERLGLLTPTRNAANYRGETSDDYFEHIFQEERELRERELALAQEKEYLAHNLKQRLSLLLSDPEEEIRSGSTYSSKKSSRRTDTDKLQYDNVNYKFPDVGDGMNRISAYVSGNCGSASGNTSGIHPRSDYGICLRGVSPVLSSQRPPPPIMRIQPLQSPSPPAGMISRLQQRQPFTLQQRINRTNAGVQTEPATEEPTGGRPLTIERDETYSKRIPSPQHGASSTSSLSLPCESEASSVEGTAETRSGHEREKTKPSNTPKLKGKKKLAHKPTEKGMLVDISNKSVGREEVGTKSPSQQNERGRSVETTLLYNDNMQTPPPPVNETVVEGSHTSHKVLSPMPHLNRDSKGVIVFSSTPVYTHQISLSPHSGSHRVDANESRTTTVSVNRENQKNNNTKNTNSNKKSSTTSYKSTSGNQQPSTQYGVEAMTFEPSITSPRTAPWYIPTSRVLEHSEFKNLLCGNWMPPPPQSVNVEETHPTDPPTEQMEDVPINSPSDIKEASLPPMSPAEMRQDATPEAADYIVQFPHLPDMPPPGKQRKRKCHCKCCGGCGGCSHCGRCGNCDSCGHCGRCGDCDGCGGCGGCCSFWPCFRFSRHFPFLKCGKKKKKNRGGNV